MILVILLLLFRVVTSKLDQESSCLRQTKCSEVESPGCLRVKRNQKIIHIVVFNQCEIQRIKCSEGKDATVVPMSNCHYGNETLYLRSRTTTKNQTKNDFLPNRVITDGYQRDMAFMMDISLRSQNRTNIKRMIVDTVKQIAEEAAKYYDVTFYVFSTTAMGDGPSTQLYKDGPYKDVTKFLNKWSAYVYSFINDNSKPDYCNGIILWAVRNFTFTDFGANSYLYVFTHSLAKDYNLTEEWPSNNVTVTVVMLPDCLTRGVRRKPGFQAYYDLAILTNGLLLRTRYDSDVAQLTEYVKHTALAFETEVILSREVSTNGSYIPFRVEKSVAYVVISMCGSNMDFAITDDWGNRIMPQFIINRDHTKVYRFVALPPHSYAVRVDLSVFPLGKWNVTVNIMSSKVDFTFKYRESTKPKWRDSLRGLDGSKKPKYLVIKVTDKRNLVDVKKVKFIELDASGQEDVIATHTLIKIAENVYSTEFEIVMPTHSFFMVVAGILKATKKEVESRDVKYIPTEESSESTEETTSTSTRSPFPTSTCSMLPETLLGKGEKNKWDNQTLLRWKQFRGSCPKQCPVRDVMVCARCQHGVQSTFMSDCHLRMFQCKYPRDKLILVARRPCMELGPFLGDMPRPEERLAEPDDEDRVSAHIHDSRGNIHELALL